MICPATGPRPDLRPGKPYAVIHAAPMFGYKRWHAEGWRGGTASGGGGSWSAPTWRGTASGGDGSWGAPRRWGGEYGV